MRAKKRPNITHAPDIAIDFALVSLIIIIKY